MTSSKIFAGSRLRRLRNQLGLSQLAFAGELGLSPSYLNLMERDQRPLTAQVVLKLSGMEGVDIAELAAGEAAHALLQPLREMVADPLLAGEVPPGNELAEALQTAPNFAAATLKLYEAYRELQNRLADAARGLPPKPRQASLQDWLSQRGRNDIEGLAEDIHTEISPKDDILAGLKARLRALAGIDLRIMPETVMGADRSRYDRHAQRLLVSEALPFTARIYEAAHLVARLEGKAVVDNAIAAFAERPEQHRAARAALLDDLATAILMPRGRFSAAATDLKSNITALAKRFSMTEALVMQRLAQVNDSLAFLAVDATGRALKQTGSLPFLLPKDEPLCGQMPLFDEGQGFHFAAMAGTVVVAQQGAALFMPPTEFTRSVYARQVDQRPIGGTCRLCEVKNCTKRSAQSAMRPAGLNDYIRGPTDFEPV